VAFGPVIFCTIFRLKVSEYGMFRVPYRLLFFCFFPAPATIKSPVAVKTILAQGPEDQIQQWLPTRRTTPFS
jgi:hypothetical protein